MTRKTFGGKTAPAPRKDFTMIFKRGEVDVPHDFWAVVRMDAAGLKRAFRKMKDDPEESLEVTFSIVAGQLDDTDGVPDGWEPTPLRMVPAWPPSTENPSTATRYERYTEEELADGVPDGAVFLAPIGEPGRYLPWGQCEEFLAHRPGSSRRRWVDLIDNHEDLSIEMADITELSEWLIGLAAERPTRR